MIIYIFDLDDTLVKHKSLLSIDYNDYQPNILFTRLLQRCPCDKKYIFTNGTDDHTDIILNNMNIIKEFNGIYTRTDNISMKPDIKSYTYVENKIIENTYSISNQYIFFDDQLPNLYIAKKYFHWKTIWINDKFLDKPYYVDESYPNIFHALLYKRSNKN